MPVVVILWTLEYPVSIYAVISADLSMFVLEMLLALSVSLSCKQKYG